MMLPDMMASNLKQGLSHLVVYLKMTVLVVQQVGIDGGIIKVVLMEVQQVDA